MNTEYRKERVRSSHMASGHGSIKYADRERERQEKEAFIERDERIPVSVSDGWDDLWSGKVR